MKHDAPSTWSPLCSLTRYKGRDLLLPLVFLTVYYLFVYHNPGGSHIRIHDNLDSIHVYYKFLAENRLLFSPLDTITDRIIGGLNRDFLPSEMNIGVLMYRILPPVGAYILNDILVRLIAFAGMYLLLTRFLTANHPRLAAWISLSFAFLPHNFISIFITVYGVPLLIYVLLLFVEERAKPWHWGIILLLPFYSSLVRGGFIHALIIFAFLVHASLKGRKLHWRLLLVLVIYVLLSVISEYRLFYQYFLAGQKVVSHRSDWTPTGDSLVTCLRKTFSMLVLGGQKVKAYQALFLIPTLAAAAMLGRKGRSREWKYAKVILSIILFVSVIYGFIGWSGVQQVGENWGLFRSFQWSRIYYLNAPLWYMLFGLCLVILFDQLKNHRVITSLIALQLALVILGNYPIGESLKKFYDRPGPTYREFYASGLFDEIRRDTDYENVPYAVVSIGLEPSVPLYNGFRTLDAYLPYYPLEYRILFRKVIASELDKNAVIREYFDSWGNRIYIFTEELSKRRTIGKHASGNLSLRNLDLDLLPLRDLGLKYVISAVKIENCEENDLDLFGIYENRDSYYRLYVYRVNWTSAEAPSSG